VQVHPKLTELSINSELEVRLEAAFEAEMDEQWSYVGNKANQRWLWYAIDHATNTVLAYVFGKRKDEVFQTLKALLEPYQIVRYYTDDWGAYQRHLNSDKHEVGKRNTQKIERKNLTIEHGSNGSIAKPSAFQNWNYCMIPLSVCSSTRSSLDLIFMPNYRFDPLPKCCISESLQGLN